jgi:hypothetical protein
MPARERWDSVSCLPFPQWSFRPLKQPMYGDRKATAADIAVSDASDNMDEPTAGMMVSAGDLYIIQNHFYIDLIRITNHRITNTPSVIGTAIIFLQVDDTVLRGIIVLLCR